jgi:hypothetical protein
MNKVNNKFIMDFSIKRIFRFYLAVMLFAFVAYQIIPIQPIPEGVSFHNPSVFDVINNFIGIGSAQEIFNESYSSSGGSTNSETISQTGSDSVVAASVVGAISNLYINWDNNKILSKILFVNTYQVTTGTKTFSLTSGANGLNAVYTTFNSTVGGINYGGGYLGWERTTGNSYNYVLYFTNINTSEAGILTGKQELVLSYNLSVYGDYVDTSSQGLVNSYLTPPTYSYGYALVGFERNSCGVCKAIAVGNIQISSSFIILYSQSVHIISPGWGYVNITKNSNNLRYNITNASGHSVYDITSSSNANIFTYFGGGITTYIYSPVSNTWVNRTIINANGQIQGTAPSDYKSTDGFIYWASKSYNFNDNATLNYSLTNPDYSANYYKIIIYRPDGTIYIQSYINVGYLGYYTLNTIDSIGTWNATLISYPRLHPENINIISYDTTNVNNNGFAGSSLSWDKHNYATGATGLLNYSIADSYSGSFFIYNHIIVQDLSTKITLADISLSDNNGSKSVIFPKAGAYGAYLYNVNSLSGATVLLAYSAANAINGLPGGGYAVEVNPKIQVCNGQITLIGYAPTAQPNLYINVSSNNSLVSSDQVSGTTNSFLHYYGNVSGSFNVQLENNSSIVGTDSFFINACGLKPITTPIVTPPQSTQQQTSSIANLLGSNLFWALIFTAGMMVMVAFATSQKKE